MGDFDSLLTERGLQFKQYCILCLCQTVFRYIDPKIDGQYQSRTGQIIEYDDRLWLSKDPRNFLDCCQNDFPGNGWIGAMRQAEAEVDAPLAGAGVIHDGVCEHTRIWQDHNPSIGCSDFGGAQVDRQHGSLEAGQFNRFTYMEWLLKQQDDPRGEIFHDVL